MIFAASGPGMQPESFGRADAGWFGTGEAVSMEVSCRSFEREDYCGFLERKTVGPAKWRRLQRSVLGRLVAEEAGARHAGQGSGVRTGRHRGSEAGGGSIEMRRAGNAANHIVYATNDTL